MKHLRFPALVVGLAACAPHQVRLAEISSSVAETISLLGDTLYSLPLDAASGPARARRIADARNEAVHNPKDLRVMLRLARSTVAMGRLREAVDILSAAAELHFDDPRIFRERGEALLRLRQIDLAIKDLRKAGLLAVSMPPFPETNESFGVTGGPLTTLQYQTAYLLGVALYCRADYAGARQALAEAAVAAISPDDRVRAMLWLFFAVRRIDDGADAPGVLSVVEPGWATSSSTPEIELLMAYKGLVPSDTIRARAMAARDDQRSLFGYGIGYYLLLVPERRAEGELWLEQARTAPNWAALSYLAAEADLVRLRTAKP